MIVRMGEDEKEITRALSKAAFGQSYRLEVMLAVEASTDGLVTLTELTKEVGVSASNIQKPIESMVAAGLLTELPRGDSRTKHMLRNPSAAWEWARELQKQAQLSSMHS